MSGTPYLSIVVGSRNDDHAGGMRERMRACVHGIIAQARRHRVKAELLIVEWNPPCDRPPLETIFDWPSESACDVRMITVPPSIHSRFPYADKKAFHPMVAWNVGIRRARGRFVLTTTADILLSDELAAHLALERLDPACVYRMTRTDVRREAAAITPIEAQLAFCRDNILGEAPQATLELPKRYRVPKLHLSAPGDFMLMSRDGWVGLRGFPEFDIVGTGVDIIVCHMAARAGLKEVVLEPPMRLYHVDHSSMWDNPKHPVERALVKGLRLKKLLPRSVRRTVGPIARKLFPERPSKWEQMGIPRLSYEQLEDAVVALYRGEQPFPPNGEGWGLAGETLVEHVILPRGQAGAT
jgi:hypothetical protein